jgi:hypothetical protein
MAWAGMAWGKSDCSDDADTPEEADIAFWGMGGYDPFKPFRLRHLRFLNNSSEGVR